MAGTWQSKSKLENTAIIQTKTTQRKSNKEEKKMRTERDRERAQAELHIRIQQGTKDPVMAKATPTIITIKRSLIRINLTSRFNRTFKEKQLRIQFVTTATC